MTTNDRHRPPAARRRRRACAALVWAPLCFVALQVGLLVAMEDWRSELALPEYGYRMTTFRKELARKGDRPLLVILGSSRSEIGINPADLGQLPTADGREAWAFNFALSSSGPVEELLYLKRLLARGIRPDYLAVEIFPLGLCYREEDLTAYINGGPRIDQYLWQDLGTLSEHCRGSLAPYETWLKDRWLACSSRRARILSYFAPNWVPKDRREEQLRWAPDRTGWLAWPQTLNAAQRQDYWVTTTRVYRHPLSIFAIDPTPARIVGELLGLCRQHGIRVGLFLMPECTTVRGWYSPGSEAELQGYLDRLAREWGVAVVNAHDWSDDEEFADGHHLMHDGARRFSRRFGREFIRPLVAGERRDE